jgi:hypothetical protein
MTAQTLLAVEVSRLLAGVSSHVNRHLQEVEGDLHQTNSLLSEAIGKLTESFMAIHAAVDAQQGIFDQLTGQDGVGRAHAYAFNAHADEIRQHVNAIVTGMQFQDMTEQLIKRTTKRVEGVRDVLETLGSQGGQLASSVPADHVASVVGKLDVLVRQQSEGLEQSMWKAVCQTRMDSGDIELF